MEVNLAFPKIESQDEAVPASESCGISGSDH